MIKVLLIDDEEVAVSLLQLMIERHLPEITSIKTVSSPVAAADAINEYKPDIVFLDIEMPYLNGFEILRSLPEIFFDVVFTTAYDKYAIQAIKFSALDYLLKPIDADELKETYNRFIEKSAVRQNKDAAVKNLLSNLQQENKTRHKLALPTTNGLEFFLPGDIVRCEGMSNYTKFHFLNHHSITTSKTIKEYEEILLPHQFVRTHKSHLVNAGFVAGYASATGNLMMKDGSLVEISRRRKKEVLEVLGMKG